MLDRERNETRILFLFADGMPSDYDYDNGLHDSAMAVKEAVDRGIQVFYILSRNRSAMSPEERSRFSRVSRYATDKKIVFDPAQLPFRTRDIFNHHLR